MDSDNPDKKLNNGKEEEKSVASCELLIKSIKENIQQKTSEAYELKEITQKQLSNISELQKKCEESFIAINHLPQNKSIATKRFEKAMKQSGVVQSKQIQVNELLNIAMKEFDEISVMSNKSKEQFKSEEELANQRNMIYTTNVSQIKALSENIIGSYRKSVETKSSELSILNSFIEANNEQKLQKQLSQMKLDINNLEIVNSRYEKDLLQVESELKSVDIKTKTLQETMTSKLMSAEEELKIHTTRCEERKHELANVQNEITSVFSDNQQLLELSNALTDKLNERKKESAEILQEISLKKQNLDSVKKNLEDCLHTCNQHRDTAKEVLRTEHLCNLSQNHLTQLEEEKDRLLQAQHNINNELDRAKESIEKIKNDLTDKNSGFEETKINQNELNIKVNQLKETHTEEVKSFDKKMLEISEQITDLQIKKLNKIESIKNNTERIEELKRLLSIENEECTIMKKKLTDLREENKISLLKKESSLNDIKSKYADISNELETKRSELKEKLETKDVVLVLLEKMKEEKTKRAEMMERFEKEKNDLKTSFNDNLESWLGELQKVKEEKQTRLDEVKDGASKAEFVYYRVKRLLQRHRGEMTYVKDTLKTYNCENEMMKMLISWLNTDSSANSVTSVPSNAGSEVIPPIRLQEAEDIDDDDMSTQEYYTPSKRKDLTKGTSNKPKESSQKMRAQGIAVINPKSDVNPPQKNVKDGNPKENNSVSLDGSIGEMKVPPIPKRLRRQSTVSTERRSGLSMLKKPRKEVEEKTILDLVLDTDSQSSA